MLRSELEAIKSHPVKYQSGFNQTFQTEAIEGALPKTQNSPRLIHGLFAEQLNGQDLQFTGSGTNGAGCMFKTFD